MLSSTVCSSASTPVTPFHFEKGDCVNGLNRILSKNITDDLTPQSRSVPQRMSVATSPESFWVLASEPP